MSPSWGSSRATSVPSRPSGGEEVIAWGNDANDVTSATDARPGAALPVTGSGSALTERTLVTGGRSPESGSSADDPFRPAAVGVANGVVVALDATSPGEVRGVMAMTMPATANTAMTPSASAVTWLWWPGSTSALVGPSSEGCLQVRS